MAFFSCTDISTLKEQAKQCNNVLSLVVNNDGNYVAKFTEKHNVHEDIAIKEDIISTDSWNFMGENNDSTKDERTEYKNDVNDYVEIKCWDCEIERPLDTDIDEAFKEECIRKIDLFKNKKTDNTIHFKDVSGKPKYYYPSLWADEEMDSDDYNEYIHNGNVIKAVNSIFSLSFNGDNSGYWYEDNLDDNLKESFYIHFMETWHCYYNFNRGEIKEVIQEILVRDPDSNRKSLKTILTWLYTMSTGYTN